MFRIYIQKITIYLESKLIPKNNLNLGRWNSKNKEIYMVWANYDNCYNNLHKNKQ